MQPDHVDPLIFQTMNSVGLNSKSLKYVYKDIGIRNYRTKDQNCLKQGLMRREGGGPEGEQKKFPPIGRTSSSPLPVLKKRNDSFYF